MADDTPLVTRMESPSASTPTRHAPGLPEDVLRESVRRLRVVALIYAGGFFLGEGAFTLFDPIARADFARFSGWGPSAISIPAALLVAVLAGSRRIPPATLMRVGLVFEVIAAYGIAFSAYWGIYPGLEYEPAHLSIFGLSFVAPWIMFFTIVAPTEPWQALIAAIGAASSVPVVLMLTMAYGGTSIVPTPGFWVAAILVPYLMVVLTAWVGARVVYSLGTAVTRARELGSYRLAKRLGGGGMGEVWLAKHRMLARPAAIKLIRPDRLGAGSRESPATLQQRFAREAQATALMTSPHTIEVYDFGVTADGTFYYVMELLHGFDLETLVQRFGPVPSERAVYLLRQVCDSLMEAHAYELIHRDIKPANVYLCRRGRPVDFVKVLDFGLVKLQHEVGAASAHLTAADVAGGTPAYMAPEQACGEPVDARTDLYAVGCLAYWLLTGQLVFESKSPVAMMSHHLRTPPVPPSQRSEVPIPTPIEQVVLSCLEKDPSRRPQTAEDLDASLAACEREVRWTPERAEDWWTLHHPPMVTSRQTGGQLLEVS